MDEVVLTVPWYGCRAFTSCSADRILRRVFQLARISKGGAGVGPTCVASVREKVVLLFEEQYLLAFQNMLKVLCLVHLFVGVSKSQLFILTRCYR